MVLRVSNKRIVSNVENTPPTASSTLKVASSVRRALADASRRRTRGVPNKRADHAASVNRKRRQIAKKTSMVTIIVPRLADPDVEMSDSTSRLASTISTSMKLPRHLARVEFPEVASESIAAIRPELEDADLQFIRDTLAVYGTSMLQVLASVETNAATKGKIHRELPAVVKNPDASEPPTHFLGIHGSLKEKKDGPAVSLYPIHDLVMAANCSKVPAFQPVDLAENSRDVTLPVVYLQLPFPKHFPPMLHYIYTKQTSIFQTAPYLSLSLPSALQQNPKDRKALRLFAMEFARKFCPEELVRQSRATYETWANMAALGVVDEPMWAAMELNWEILLAAIAISTGTELGNVEPESQEEEATPSS